MPFCAEEVGEWVIAETLRELDLKWCENTFMSAQQLLLATAIQESNLGERMQCCRRLGLYLISPALHKSVWDNYLIKDPELASRVRGMAGQHSFLRNPHIELLTNLKYATAIALMVYLRNGQPLPAYGNLREMAIYWHRHFHPKADACTTEFVRNYREVVGETSRLAA